MCVLYVCDVWSVSSAALLLDVYCQIYILRYIYFTWINRYLIHYLRYAVFQSTQGGFRRGSAGWANQAASWELTLEEEECYSVTAVVSLFMFCDVLSLQSDLLLSHTHTHTQGSSRFARTLSLRRLRVEDVRVTRKSMWRLSFIEVFLFFVAPSFMITDTYAVCCMLLSYAAALPHIDWFLRCSVRIVCLGSH